VIVSGTNRSESFVSPTATVWTVAAMVVVLPNKKRNKCLADDRRSEERQFRWDDKIGFFKKR
jgi:hypothetical protein